MAGTRSCALLAVFAAASCVLARAAPAQTFPAKPVRYTISPSARGGPDGIARIITSGMTPALGQQLIVEYRPGASGNIAAETVARSAPDGYMLLQASMTYAANATIFPKLGYDLVGDFAPVTLLATS